MHGRAPYRGVLTHGFTVDEKGRKMSKSIGNTLVPQKLTSTLGADVVRLWVAATDYANEMSVSDEILKRMADSYRRMRNTLRFLLGQSAWLRSGASTRWRSMTWWRSINGRSAKAFALQNDVVTAYRNYEFHDIYQKIHNFCVVELGGFYLDIIKDRLYTTGASSAPRRSAQTAMHHVAQAMVRWLAPILSFTAEEVWGFLPGVPQRIGVPEYLASVSRRRRARTDDRLAGVDRAQSGCRARSGAVARRRRDRRPARGGGDGLRAGRAGRRASRRCAMNCDSC